MTGFITTLNNMTLSKQITLLGVMIGNRAYKINASELNLDNNPDGDHIDYIYIIQI